MKQNNLILDYNEKPAKKSQWFFLSFQHVFAMFSATVLVPLLTGLPISTALFASGVGTLIYILCTKGKVPIYLGSSFAYIEYICAVAVYTTLESGEKVISSFFMRYAFTSVYFGHFYPQISWEKKRKT